MKSDDTQVIDFSDIRQKRQFLEGAQRLKGLYEVTVKKRKLTRTLKANAFYFAAVVSPWRDFLREAYGDNRISTDDAHEALKEAVLGRDVKVSKLTGDEMSFPIRTRDMNIDEFNQYIEQASQFLASFAGIVVLDSSLFYEQQPTQKAS